MKTQLACKKCGHTWSPHRGTNPKECPKCKSYEWNSQLSEVVAVTLSCKHCGHRWGTRRGAEPKVCPRCKSYNWDKDKVPKVARLCLVCACFTDRCTRGKEGPDGRGKCDGFIGRFTPVESKTLADELPDI